MRLPVALTPLEGPVFRGLWFAWLAANLTMWMNDVAAAWLMTTLTTSPVMVALVQTASTLPVFLLGLPSGALADIVNRRRYYAATQLWVSVNALLLVCGVACSVQALLSLHGSLCWSAAAWHWKALRNLLRPITPSLPFETVLLALFWLVSSLTLSKSSETAISCP